MASDTQLAPALYRCYYCQFESNENSFKYFDNKEVDQPRHQCHNCHKLFTLGSHGRPQGRTYAKKRNEDPEELKGLSRQCRHCGVADNALFKYYNNNNRLQPRFKCLSCGKQFQMRLMGTGDEMRLVHNSCNQRHATGHCKKPREPEAFTHASNFGEEIYQPSDGSFMPVPCDPVMPLEPSARLFPETCEEDAQYASFLETELTEENESPNNADPVSCNANMDNGLLTELSAEDAECLALLELESLTDENEQAPDADPIFCTLSGDDGLPPALSAAENAEFLGFLEAGFLTDGNEAPWNVDADSSTANVDDGNLPLWDGNDVDFLDFEVIEPGLRADESYNDAEMVSENVTSMDSECTSNPEVVSGTLFVETLAPTEPDSWSNDTAIEDSSSLNYMEAALACCKHMDMAHSMPVVAVQVDDSSSSNVDGGLLPWSDNDAEFMNFEFVEAGVRTDASEDAEMVSENMTNMVSDCTSNFEGVPNTLLVETLAPAASDSWSNVTIEESSSLNYLEAALACCKHMDMGHSMPVAPEQLGESASSSVGSTIWFGDSSCATSEPVSFQQDLMEEDQHSVSNWNEWQEEEDDMQMAPWS